MKGELISTALAILIIAGSAILVVNNIMPVIDEGRDAQSFTEAKKTLESIDSAISQLLFEAPGARRTVDVVLDKGRMIVAGGEDKIKIRLEDIKLFTPGIRRLEGNVLVTSGEQVESYEADIDNDGTRDLVLENSAVLFAMKKIGTPASPSIVNTTNMITLIRNKRLSTDIQKPRSGIFINDTARSSYGIGYSELTQRSANIASAGIRVFVNATDANLTYDAVFTLGPSQDFVEFYITHVTGV